MNKSVLVTGGTGVVGSALIPELIEDGWEIFLIVRARNDEHLRERKNELLQYLKNGDGLSFDKIQFIRGDIGLPQLGLEDSLYEKIGNQITHIVHSAANVRLDLPLQETLKETLDSVKHILSLQKKSKAKLEYVSTVGVLGRKPEPLFEERVSTDREYFNSYECAKAHAEQLVYQSIDQGHETTIHRPSMVVGNSLSGKIIHFQIFYYLLRLLSGSLTKGFLISLAGVKLDTIPSDFVARFILCSMNSRESIGRIFHQSTGSANSIFLLDLQSMIRKELELSGQRIPHLYYLPHFFFKGLWFAQFIPGLSQSWKTRFKLFPQLVDYALASQKFESEVSKNWIQRFDVNMPLPKEYLPQVIHFYGQSLGKSRNK